MKRLLTIVVAALAGAAGMAVAAPRDGAGAPAASAKPTVLHVGDRVTVDGQPLGCRVARQGGHVVMDCRRGGSLAGTYGTLLTARRARVVRFRDNTLAKVVFTAEHGGGARTCDP
ncbi:hypothetical protein [Baekduia sp. Peel2402]|uniref:hypothetical protein n=1 Tax=Baekduia sp. Peel2402 TaxID=3458296 RepID=UPI00403EF0CF